MQSLEFNLENIREIELFTGAKLESYFQIGIPVGRFVFPKKEGEEKIEFELKQGEIVFKSEDGFLFKKIN